MMQDPAADPIWCLNRILSAVSRVYGGMVRLRNRCYETGIFPTDRIDCKVVSVGNIAAGGTGKTPMTAYVAKRLAETGKRTAVISRGYGGTAVKTGGVVSDGNRILMTAEDGGDEPYMLARQLPGIPVLVGGNRLESGRKAVNELHAQMIVLDDGFQHRRLHRDLDLALLDAGRPFGNFRLLPRGPLREPPQALFRSSAVILTGLGEGFDTAELPEPLRGLLSGAAIPLFHAVKIPRVRRRILRNGRGAAETTPPDLSGAKVFVFSGIADNRAFLRSVADLKGRLVGSDGFCDHHRYRPEQIESVFDQAMERGADMVATTEKDYARMAEQEAFPLDLVVVGLDISFGDQTAAFDALLRQKLDF